MLVAAAGDRERVVAHVEPLAEPQPGGDVARDRGRPVRRAVVDQHHPLDRPQQRRQRVGQRARLVARAQHGGEAGLERAVRPAPADVEVGLALDVRERGGAGVPDLPGAGRLQPGLGRLRALHRAAARAGGAARAARGRRSRSAGPAAAAPPPPPRPTGRPAPRRAARIRRRRSRPRGARRAPRARAGRTTPGGSGSGDSFSWRAAPCGPGAWSCSSASVSPSRSTRPTWSSGSCATSACWTAQWTSSPAPPPSAATKRRKSATTASGSSACAGTTARRRTARRTAARAAAASTASPTTGARRGRGRARSAASRARRGSAPRSASS